MSQRLRPGAVRDAILDSFASTDSLTVRELRQSVTERLGTDVARSSVQSYLNLNTPELFERVGRGSYRLVGK